MQIVEKPGFIQSQTCWIFLYIFLKYFLLSYCYPDQALHHHTSPTKNLIQCDNFTKENSDLLQIIEEIDFVWVLPKVGLESWPIGKHFVAFMFLASFALQLGYLCDLVRQCILGGILLVAYGKCFAFLVNRTYRTFFPTSPFFCLECKLDI